MERITVSDLEAVVARINRTVNGTDELPVWDVYITDGRREMRQNANVYHLSGAYGGYALHRNCEANGDGESHGIHDVLGGHMPKRELYDQMQAFLRGRDA